MYPRKTTKLDVGVFQRTFIETGKIKKAHSQFAVVKDSFEEDRTRKTAGSKVFSA